MGLWTNNFTLQDIGFCVDLINQAKLIEGTLIYVAISNSSANAGTILGLWGGCGTIAGMITSELGSYLFEEDIAAPFAYLCLPMTSLLFVLCLINLLFCSKSN
jgi:hypothetical protein